MPNPQPGGLDDLFLVFSSFISGKPTNATRKLQTFWSITSNLHFWQAFSFLSPGDVPDEKNTASYRMYTFQQKSNKVCWMKPAWKKLSSLDCFCQYPITIYSTGENINSFSTWMVSLLLDKEINMVASDQAKLIWKG